MTKIHPIDWTNKEFDTLLNLLITNTTQNSNAILSLLQIKTIYKPKVYKQNILDRFNEKIIQKRLKLFKEMEQLNININPNDPKVLYLLPNYNRKEKEKANKIKFPIKNFKQLNKINPL